MKEVPLFADMTPATAKIVGSRRLRDRGQAQNCKTGLVFQEIAYEVLDMDPLHHDHNASSLLVVGSGHQGRAVPLNHALAAHLGYGVARLERIIDDKKIAAPSS